MVPPNAPALAGGLAIVTGYKARGCRLVVYARGTKGPQGPEAVNWTARDDQPEDYREGQNVGIFTGTEIAPGRYLVDVDFDWTDGLSMVRRLFAVTGFGFGRQSRPLSHAFYTTSTPQVSKSYDDIDGKGFVELRGTKVDGTVGLQTMAPPSVHPSGEVVELRKSGEISHDDELPRHVRCYAIACILFRHLGPRGLLHDTRLAVAGFLLGEGLAAADVIAIGEAIAEVSGNTVADVAPTVHTTAARLHNENATTGAGTLAKAIGGDDGKKVIARIREWLGTSALVLDPGDPLRSARTFIEQRHLIDKVLALRYQAGEFYVYRPDASAYEACDEAAVRADVYHFLEKATCATKDKDVQVPFKPTKAKVENVLDAVRAVTNLPKAMAPPCWLDGATGPNPLDLLACTNGLVHIPTRALHPASPSLFTLNGLTFAFDPDAPEPARWLAFLAELWPDDAESIATLQEWVGYLLTPDTRFQKMLMIIGPKRSGKGTLARVVRRLLGDRNVCGPTLANMAEQHGLAVLIGKTAAVIADARVGGHTGVITERLLSISGEDPLSVPRKYLPDWDGTLRVRFLLLTNELPRIEDSSGALSSRFLLLALHQSFYGREDHNLLERLTPELPGILNWALAGRDRLYARGHFIQPQSSLELIQQFENLGSPIGAFLRDCCVVQPGATVSQPDLFEAWKAWCDSNGRDRPGTAQSFGRNLRAAVPWLRESRPRDGDGDRLRHYEGVGLLAVGEGGEPEPLPF